MTTYIGPLGGLVAVDCPSSLRPVAERPTATRVTTSGVVRQQVAQRSSREWSLSWGAARPEQIANLAALAAGEFGIGPFWFVDPWAQVTNLLAPDWSTFNHEAPSNTVIGGPVNLGGGARAGRSLAVANPALAVTLPRIGTALQRVPVVPGMPVCVSAYASGGGAVEVRLSWGAVDGSDAGASSWRSFTPGGSMGRVWQAAYPPANAASVVMNIRGANRIARPAVTWTSSPVDWHVGQGAPTVAIPASLSQDIILATSRPGGRLASVSTTIREVG